MENITKEKHAKNMEKCLMFDKCSAPICPLDFEASIRFKDPKDDVCPYCRRDTKKGMRKSMPEELRKLVPDCNVKLLRHRNQTLNLH